jgi:parvulin-like peptidyl-prolyl isomerase
MLEGMRRQGASIFIYIVFGILIAMFVINFGPQSRGGPGQGCGDGGSDTAITVAGTQVRAPTAFRSVYSFFKANGAREQDAKTSAMEFLVRREILAQAAEERGLVTTQEMAQAEIMRGFMFVGGQRVNLHDQFFEKLTDGDEAFFSYKRFEGFIGSLNVTRAVFVEQQQRELLAAMQAETLRGAATVSRDEALAEFLYERNTATYDVVTFSPRAYRNAFVLSDEDVARYASTHAAEVEAKYKADERLYKGVKPQAHVRQIFVAKAAPAAAKPVDPAKPAADAAKPAEADAPDAGKAKLEAARAEIASGKLTFAAAARDLSSDAAEKASGGEAGWQTKEFPTLAETALNDAVKKLKAGEVSEVITTDRGFYLVTVQEERQGDLTLEQVKLEISSELARDGWSKEAARRAAIAALDAAQRSALKNLNQLYKPAASNNTRDIQELINNPNLTDEMKQQLLQQYLQEQGKSGSLSYESANVPAEWADSQGEAPAGGSAAAPAPAAAATTAAPAATDAVPTATATAAPTTTVPPVGGEGDLMKPSSEVLPQMNAVEPPNVTRAGPTPRASRLPELGGSKPAARAVFDELSANELAKQIYQVDDAYVLVQLIERQQPKMEDFDKDADQRIRGLRDQRGQALVESWLKERCEALSKANRIKANPALTREMDDKGKYGPSFYRPCMSFR